MTRTAWSASEPEADDVQSLAVASCTFSLWSEQIDAVATASGDEADTVHAVFSTLARPGGDGSSNQLQLHQIFEMPVAGKGCRFLELWKPSMPKSATSVSASSWAEPWEPEQYIMLST